MVSMKHRKSHWASPGVEHVADGVYRIPVPLPMAGLPAVNVYVLPGPDGVVLIDAGWDSQDAREALGAGLAELEYHLSDITSILVTHMHWDHYTLAVTLRREFGCTLLVGAGEEASIRAFDQSQGLYPQYLPRLRAGGAERVADLLESRPPEAYETDVAYAPADIWIRDGERIPVPGGEVEARSTPGHTSGHTVFLHETKAVIFTGDHILPTASPAIGLDNVLVEDPLSDYLDSLTLLLSGPDHQMLPAHGMPGGSVHTRTRELLSHHAERLDEILEHVRHGRRTAMEIADAMPWTREQVRMNGLDSVAQMNAVMEVDAHLRVLRKRDLVSSATRGHIEVYRGL